MQVLPVSQDGIEVIAHSEWLETAKEPRGTVKTMLKVEAALEKAGIEFIPAEGGKGPSVRLRQEESSAADRPRR
jgi:hypothetical protein